MTPQSSRCGQKGTGLCTSHSFLPHQPPQYSPPATSTTLATWYPECCKKAKRCKSGQPIPWDEKFNQWRVGTRKGPGRDLPSPSAPRAIFSLCSLSGGVPRAEWMRLPRWVIPAPLEAAASASACASLCTYHISPCPLASFLHSLPYVCTSQLKHEHFHPGLRLCFLENLS